MSDRSEGRRAGSRGVPGFGGPGSDESAPDGQSALRLHAGIAAIATVLCFFVTAIFILSGAVPLAVVFGVIGGICLALLFWALHRKRRGAQEAQHER